MIQLCQLTKTYAGPAGDVIALKGIDLNVSAGEFLIVAGKSGAGKTTLINMIAGLDRITRGQVWVSGAPVHQLSTDRAARWRRRTVGVVFQTFELLPSLTVLQNVLLPMDLADYLSPRQRRERAMHLLDLVEIAGHAHKRPSAVSGGQQQRVAIARALANDPPLIVADEPTGSLDSQTAAAVLKIFASLAAQGKTILMATHDLKLAGVWAGRTVTLHDGEVR